MTFNASNAIAQSEKLWERWHTFQGTSATLEMAQMVETSNAYDTFDIRLKKNTIQPSIQILRLAQKD